MGIVYVNGVSALMGCCITHASAGPGRRVVCHHGLNWGAASPSVGDLSPAISCSGDRCHQRGWSAVPELSSSPSQHHAAGNGVHSHVSSPCPGVYGSLLPFPAPLLPARAGGLCRGLGEWGASSITAPVAASWLAPRQVVMPGVLITPSPALLSHNWSGRLVIPHLPTAQALTALATEPDLPGRRRLRAGEARGGG